MLWELIAFGGILFWLLALVELAVVVGCLHFKRGGSATLSMVVFLLLLWLFSDINVFSWCWHNPYYAGYGALGYIIMASLWGFAKWTLYQRENSYRYLELRNNFKMENKIEVEEFTPAMKVQWADYFSRHRQCDDFWESEVEFNPTASTHKAAILGWMTFWPVSVGWTVIDDAVIKLFRHMYYMMYGWLERIRQYYWGAFENDMPTSDDYRASPSRRSDYQSQDD